MTGEIPPPPLRSLGRPVPGWRCACGAPVFPDPATVWGAGDTPAPVWVWPKGAWWCEGCGWVTTGSRKTDFT